jgi:predicted Zn-dependent peptidase
MVWELQVFHDADKSADTIVAAIDAAIEPLRTKPVDQATLDRALVKLRSNLYSSLESLSGFGKANILASFALFDDDPYRINRLESEFAKVTPAVLQRTAQEYLRPTNRTIYTVLPARSTRTSQ